jgi:hypothetical protein
MKEARPQKEYTMQTASRKCKPVQSNKAYQGFPGDVDGSAQAVEERNGLQQSTRKLLWMMEGHNLHCTDGVFTCQDLSLQGGLT